jgi:hypothetical protein
VTHRFHLIDGALMDNTTRRREMVARMAADLIRLDAFRTEGDAVRTLYGGGYGAFNVALLAGEAMFEAQQQVIAGEIAR